MSLFSILSLSDKELAWAAGLLLVATLAVGAVLLGPKNSLQGRKGAPLPIKSLGNSPVIQLELARTEQDLRDILLVGDVHANVADARAGNRIDTWLFIPLYAGSMLLMGILLARGEPHWPSALLWFSVVGVSAIAIGDWVENAAIERTLRHIEASKTPHPGDAKAISIPSLVKWSLLALVLLIYAGSALRQPGWGMTSFGIALLALGCQILVRLALYFREAAAGS
jgi:hypothetical protein